MSEKTPRDIDKEVRRLRHNQQVLAGNLDNFKWTIPINIKAAQHMDSEARQAELEPDKYEFGPDFYRSERDNALESLGYNVLRQGADIEASEANLKDAKRHYEENKAAYHTGAIAEAMMDGVHVDIDQAQGVGEAVEVKVLPPKE